MFETQTYLQAAGFKMLVPYTTSRRFRNTGGMLYKSGFTSSLFSTCACARVRFMNCYVRKIEEMLPRFSKILVKNIVLVTTNCDMYGVCGASYCRFVECCVFSLLHFPGQLRTSGSLHLWHDVQQDIFTNVLGGHTYFRLSSSFYFLFSGYWWRTLK